ncbi:energy-coupling factor transporter transmembrane protein EcfT [Streptomyces clavuligerus]|uniref:energy-coupling factor transporter transmembrane component T n=1 Tax=Streptomyces clavuligerus TaxID=1901 RepID=UPI000810B3E1|nr:energy-coupling factor transporter transmembrane component T [Streptomyces clavuligerus]ANW21758.1 cobalt ABC transporter permease [Streptomyces clavuligerus]AXU11610.1 energy-coupling factor transporter transmembrane protein EcfT [Streptomyces clavuligerus]MBY6301436.1 energy-coupling factor transporter transmembrane protein EcfT [Streptomyces clavuligerus]QPL61728.1 energy-coupling factor transporter transmembrane protein EcfT [Streptomyces clavuligerus]QPL67761.1 energy-coupling factor t
MARTTTAPDPTRPPDTTTTTGGRRLPRTLHPMAWWIWALALATAAGRTNNPLLLLLVLAVLGYVVTLRRTEAPWARGFVYYLWLALIVIAIRVVFRAVFVSGVGPDDHYLFSLPHLPMPDWYAGVRIGGPVSLEALLSAATDGLRLACMLCCIGAANTLANPKRALRVLPGALHELGVAVTVSLSVAPQLVHSAQRVTRARRLRAGDHRGFRALRGIVVPVLEDALERSLRLAAAMDSRGYGRAGTATRGSRRLTGVLMLAGMCGLCAGAYGLLDATAPTALGLPALIGGSLLCVAGLRLGGRRVARTAYRPDPWRLPEWTVAGCGVLSAVVLFANTGYDPAALTTAFHPLRWPELPPVPAAAILLAGAAALAAPPPGPPAPAGATPRPRTTEDPK